ncbi:hydroxymethylbilane synthase [Biomaibacter acetigenes]|uniref:hydroxymethylbilane synthase n=1 Tax=Biomaibacter acetigenes TaxID=2316383 RepID=UPI001FEB0748|nr:hydroxymethylbilane synthase [Biomaibacter acetigenes]
MNPQTEIQYNFSQEAIITKRLLRAGSRESKLALIQTNIVIEQLKRHYPDWEFEIVRIKTQGDKFLNAALGEVGGKGLFVKEIEEALFSGAIDMAVHSMKDVPSELPEGLHISAVTKREDPRDVFISMNGMRFSELATGARIGTSSLRRAVQLKAIRPDVEILPIRGNVSTRIKKMRELDLAGIVLAAAGIKRLGMEEVITEYFTPEMMVPAVGQGSLTVETRIDDELSELIRCINDTNTESAVKAERAFMQALGGSCKIPIGAYAEVEGNTLTLIGMVEKDGIIKKGSISQKVSLAEEAGIKLAKELGELQ